MKHFSITCLLFLLIGLTNCAEDDILSSDVSEVNLSSEGVEILNPKQPVLTRVTTDGTKVTLEFTNHASPSKPEGGYELMVDGKRTGNSITPWLKSGDKNLTMSFNIQNAASKNYQVYARWNSGYLSSNVLDANESISGETTSARTSNSANTQDVKAPSNLKQPVISGVAISGSDVTLTFVNFSAPKKPEGGFELMVNGKRTGNTYLPWLHSTEKVVTMKFRLSDAKSKYFQVYARWNSGYISSEKFYPGSSSSPVSESPTPEDEDEDDDNNNTPPTNNPSDDVDLSFLSSMKLARGYEFENNIGRNVSVSRDGLDVHHLGHDNGRVVSVDGVGAYHFRVTPGSYTRNDPSWLAELQPRDLPSPYFKNGREAIWGREYVYQMRVKLSQDFDIGREYVTLISTKNDYTVSREGSFIFSTEGDHYYIRQKYATQSGTKRGNETDRPSWYASDGEKLTPNRDFSSSSKVGSGYSSLERDKNRWVTWTCHIKWSYGSDGFVRVYKNDELFHSYTGPNSWKDSKGPYVKFGLSNSFWGNGIRTGSTEQEMYMDYFRVYAK